ncbi:MAG: sporulation/spore germination protein [Symploca sp. SIO3E6]|nr:sporulation/spore germination protein [Caldora sp. SIO3E6]
MLAGCSGDAPTTDNSNNQSGSPSTPVTESPAGSSDTKDDTPDKTQTPSPGGDKAADTGTDKNRLTLDIYQVDAQCEKLVPNKVAVSAENSVNAAVGEVLEQVASSDLELAGYRVDVDAGSGMATVDLRLSPDSQRRFLSLSTCEQLALFGSLRKTLTDNSQFNISDVRFTEQGQEIEL